MSSLMDTTLKRLRFRGFLLNVIAAAVCAVAVVGYFISPLVNAKISYTMSEELSEYLIQKGNNPNPEEGSSEEMINDIIRQLGKDRLTFSLAFSFDTVSFLGLVTAADKSKVDELLDKAIDDALDSANEQIDAVTKAFSKAALKIVIAGQIKASLPSEDGDDVMATLGIDEDYMNGAVDKVFDSIAAEDATVDSVTDSVMEVVDDLYDKMRNSEEYGSKMKDLSDEDRAKIVGNVKNAVSKLADEDGNVNTETLLAELIMNALKSREEGSEETAHIAPFMLDAEDETEPPETEGIEVEGSASEEKVTMDDVKAELKTQVKNAIPENLSSIIVTVSRVVGGVIAFCIAVWLYILLKMLIKLFFKNPQVKLKMPILFGWLLYVVMVTVPILAISVLKTPPSFVANFMPELFSKTTIFLAGLKLSLSSCSAIAAIASLVIFVFSFFYGSNRRKITKRIKELKKDNRA